ncbi:MAG TPA: cbb3-type cytochrome c oxidase subunit II [Terracidiphilus sp.]|jgi:cytochrome c oxidase cbb3-type subunit 2|nr:cbb3-type cytochrome c oxidase subunit II [Terracidiphilus sp.]
MRFDLRFQGARGIALVAITYVYFLIFAQFAFLSRLAELGIAGNPLRMILAAMAAGGILASLLAPGLAPFGAPALGIRIGLAFCGVAALVSLIPLHSAAAVGTAFLIGAGLGLLTVTLVTHLRDWTGDRHALLKVGMGTGAGYFLCNVPLIFNAQPEHQALFAAVLCAAGLCLTIQPPSVASGRAPAPRARMSFLRVLAAFAALVWLDSAAFYIIQHAPALKTGTWMGSVHLWTNACLHLCAALAAGLLLARRRLAIVLSAAFLALGSACVLLLHPANILTASTLYPVGVSFYSVALVAYPSFLTTATSPGQRARQAGWIYAVAGWIASALGIGMGQNLGRVPIAFVAVAGAVVLAPALFGIGRQRLRELVVLCAALAIALVIYRLLPEHSASGPLSPEERGRRVYISEGCINCHSQYVRPDSSDVLLWGPTESLDELHRQHPPLIGNRRQGPDLSQAGARRSPLWLKAHLVDPAQVSGASIMPPYAFLFRDQRGDDLVSYLASLHSADLAQRLAQEQAWSPSAAAVAQASAEEGEAVYRKFCATCHDAHGATRERWQTSFREKPADLFAGPFKYLPSSDPARKTRIARIAKFGIPTTDMPGHEYLGDRQLASLSLWLTEAAHPVPPSSRNTTGDTP